MKTTLRKILKYRPCGQYGCESGWGKANKSAGYPTLETEVTPMDILKHAGIKDAVWCLRVFDYKDYCLFLADVVESVVHITNDNRVVECIQAIRDYRAGKITKEELWRFAAYTATGVTAYVATDAAYTDAYAYAAAAQEQKWKEIEQLYIKHFG